MTRSRRLAVGTLAGVAAVTAACAALMQSSRAGAEPASDPEPQAWIRADEWEPETVCFATAEQAHIGPEDLSSGQILRAADEAALSGGSVCMTGRSEVEEWAERVGSIGAPARVPVPHEWTEDDVELLARLLWSSPLRHEDMKRQLVWVVLNRVDDERPIFPRTIAGNVTKREFTFFDKKAYLSETNLRIAREELERWTRVLSGIEERPVPEGYVYLRFAGDGNRMIYLMKEVGGGAGRWPDPPSNG